MKKLFLPLLLALSALPVLAQTDDATVEQVPVATVSAASLRFGYLSYEAVLKTSADYAAAQKSIADLRAKYDAEMKRVEDEFNKKYEEFLEGQRSFAPSILQKRQAELQELMEKNLKFKQESTRMLKDAEQEALLPARQKLAAAIQRVGKEQKLAFVANIDGNALPYIDPALGVDVTAAVSAAMQ